MNAMTEDEAVEYIEQFNTTDALPYITKLIWWNGREEGLKYTGKSPENEAYKQVMKNRIMYHSVPGYLVDVWKAGFIHGAELRNTCPHCGGAL